MSGVLHWSGQNDLILEPSRNHVRRRQTWTSTFLAHTRRARVSFKAGAQAGASFLQSGNRGHTGYARKIVQKVVQRVAVFQVVSKRLEGNTSSPKHRLAAENSIVPNDDIGRFHKANFTPPLQVNLSSLRRPAERAAVIQKRHAPRQRCADQCRKQPQDKFAAVTSG
ncbi:MAG: hypothetical protein JWM08_1259 [Candidatus Angelobacter sp.]|nr:hypothetical protein [Candidatus Angelobacter sp.]